MTLNTNGTRLNCEPLEHRENPAGNVTAILSGGSLFVTGDAAGNAISIQQNAAWDIWIFGLNGTTVNGQSAVFVGRGLLNGLSVQMNGGNDAVDVGGPWVWGGINVQGGIGNDTIRLAGLSGDSVVVDAGAGNDTVLMQNVFSRSSATVNGNIGFDTFIDRGVTAPFRFATGFEALA